MSNNQTIDGVLVSRELLVRLNNLTRWHFGNEAECVELRALLDAPTCKACCDQGEIFVSKGKVESHMLTEPDPIYRECPDCKPAAQPQGEPVVLPAKKYPKDWNKGTLRNCNMEYMEGYNDAVDDIAKLGPLYAEQPAPVAVAISREDLRSVYLSGYSDGQNSPNGYHCEDELSACLDEVARLNAKSQ